MGPPVKEGSESQLVDRGEQDSENCRDVEVDLTGNRSVRQETHLLDRKHVCETGNASVCLLHRKNVCLSVRQETRLLDRKHICETGNTSVRQETHL